MYQLTDTHCHLNSPLFAGRLDAVITRARRAGVGTLVTPAWDRTSAGEALALAAVHPAIRPAVGLHPWFAARDADLTWLPTLLEDPRVVAIGEIGLDGAIDDDDPTVQERVFRTQLEMALTYHLPVLLHCRRRWDRLLTCLRDYPGIRGVLHAFSGSVETLREGLSLGLFVSCAGSVTRVNSRRARAAAAGVPLDHLLLETDAPYLALDGVPAVEVEPAHLPWILAAVAGLRDEMEATLAGHLAANVTRLFTR